MSKILSRCCKIFLIFTTLCLAIFNSINFASAGTVIVGNVLSNSITLFDEATLLTIKEIKVGLMPHEVVVSPNGKIALVSNFGDLLNVLPGSTLTSIDVANAKVLQTIQLPNKSRPHGIAFISDSTALITAQGIQSLLVLDVIKGSIEKTIKLPGAGAHMVVVDAEKQFAYITNEESGTIVKIDLRDFSIVGETKIGKVTEGLALSNEGDLLFVADRMNNYVALIKTKDLTLLKIIKTDSGPIRVNIFNNGKSAIITNALSGNAQVIDIASLSITNAFKTTHSSSPLPVPINVFVKNDQKTAYFTNSFANDITLIDITTGTILKTFKAGYMPDGISYSSIDAVNADNTSDALFTSGPIDINAGIETVWHVVKNVEKYATISQGAITAHVDGEVVPGKTIELSVYKDKLIGKFIPKSNETITIVDDDRKIIAWIRKLPDGSFTERYQVLEKVSENKTRSTIALRIPDPIGAITKITLGETINASFSDLNKGIKMEAERTSNLK